MLIAVSFLTIFKNLMLFWLAKAADGIDRPTRLVTRTRPDTPVLEGLTPVRQVRSHACERPGGYRPTRC